MEIDASSIFRLMHQPSCGQSNRVCVRPLRVGRVTDNTANSMVGWWQLRQPLKLLLESGNEEPDGDGQHEVIIYG